MSDIIKQETTPSDLLQMAVDKDLDIEKLSKLMDLQKQWQADQARRAFFSAMNDFQANVPEIRKSKKVGFETRNGKTEYNYAPLADIVRQIKNTCRDCGLSYRWEIQDSNEALKVTCLITHIDGHTEMTTMTANADDSGAKNKIQARGSTIEYLKRYTLIGALGLSTTDQDIDGQVPQKTVDELHDEYMELYQKLVSLDKNYSSKADPDNWPERTGKVYVAAIGHARKLIADLTTKNNG